MLDSKMREYAERINLLYVRNDDSMQRPFEAPPVIVNFFYHEEIRKSSRLEVTSIPVICNITMNPGGGHEKPR